MADIFVTQLSHEDDKYIFEVGVHEADSETKHKVTVSESDYGEITNGKIAPQELVRKSFDFLLSREPKESILRQFDLMDISVYFPEYKEEAARF